MSDFKVVSLRGEKIVIPEAPEPEKPNEEIIAFCQELLNRAKEGDFKGIAVAISLNGVPRIATNWSDTSNDFSLMGAITMLKHDYISLIEDNEVEV